MEDDLEGVPLLILCDWYGVKGSGSCSPWCDTAAGPPGAAYLPLAYIGAPDLGAWKLEAWNGSCRLCGCLKPKRTRFCVLTYHISAGRTLQYRPITSPTNSRANPPFETRQNGVGFGTLLETLQFTVMPTTSSFYTTNLVILVLVTLLLGYYEHVASVRRGIMAATDGKDKEEGVESRTLGETRELKRFRINYLLVSCLLYSI